MKKEVIFFIKYMLILHDDLPESFLKESNEKNSNH